MFSNEYKFANENTKVYNYGNKNNVEFSLDGSMTLDITSNFLNVTQLIKFEENVPFETNEFVDLSFKNVKNELDIENGLALKKQDLLVAVIIIVLSVFYLVCDLCRAINSYKQRRKKICTCQMH